MNVETIIYCCHLLELSSCSSQEMNTFEQATSLKENRLSELGFWMVVIRQPTKSYGDIVKVKP
jgi:hypothetical protein